MAQSFIKILYPYCWRKFKFLEEDDTEAETVETFKNLRDAVWVHRIVSLWQWRHFLESPKNFLPMVSSREAYVNNVFFMVSSTIKGMRNIHESFLTTCSLVTAVAAYIHNKGYKKFLKYCPDILETLLEENFSNESDRDQIWHHFHTCDYSDAYEMVELKTNGNPFADIVNEFVFVTEIHKKIKSTISVGEQAAVYRYTTKVIKQYKTRTSRNNPVTSKENASTQTEGLLQNMEDRRKSNSGQRLLRGLVEFFNSTGQSTEEQIKSESGQRLVMVFTEFINLKIAQSHSERHLLQNQEKQEISSLTELSLPEAKKYILENEQSLDSLRVTKSAISDVDKGVNLETMEDVSLETSSSQPESSLEDARTSKIFQDDQSSYNMEDIRDLSSTILSCYLEEQSIHITENSRISNFDESTSMVRGTEDTIPKHNSPILSFQEDLKQPRKSEGEQTSLSAKEKSKDINLMENSCLQSQEQTLPNNTRERKVSNKGQAIPVIMTNNLHSDETSSHIETENPTEEDYSDALHGSEATNQNKTPHMPKRKKKKKSKKRKGKNLKTDEEKLSSTNLGDGEAVDLKILPYSEEQSLQNKEKPTETYERKQSFTNVEDEAVDLEILPYSEEQSLQNKENPRNKEESSPVPSKNEAMLALLFCNRRLNNHARMVCDIFNVRADIF